MSVIRVAIPVKKGKRRFFLAKGRPWSLVEHVFLAALVSQPRTVDELASEANLPRRLVLEALIRLMRAGWIVLSQESKGVVFSASDAGKAVVDDEELPQVSKNITRWMSFVIDKITGTLYRHRELPFIERHVVEERAKRERLVWLEPREVQANDEIAGILAALFDDDEKFLGIEQSGDRLVDRYAVVTVRNGTVEGLPPRAPRELTKIVLAAAKNAPLRPEGENSPSTNPGPPLPFSERDLPKVIEASFNPQDLIMGGPAHKELFLDAIKRAKSRLILHSTFISEDRFSDVYHLFTEAIRRGVVIDVLWGEDETKTEAITTRKTVIKIREKIATAGLSSSFRVHPFSTRSHAKILIADDYRTNKFYATVGSCNWLSSTFHSYEASVRFSDPNVVGAVLEQVAELTKGSDGHWTELTNEMGYLSVLARAQRPTMSLKAKVSIVLGPQHGQFVRMARDEAKRRIFVMSHRLGPATRIAVIVPAIAAVKDRKLEVKAYYGIQSGSVKNTDAAKLTLEAGNEGVEIRPIVDPRIHAKILAWDDDNLLITSQNWLSADPGESNMRSEIGVLIQASGVARIAIESFEASRIY